MERKCNHITTLKRAKPHKANSLLIQHFERAKRKPYMFGASTFTFLAIWAGLCISHDLFLRESFVVSFLIGVLFFLRSEEKSKNLN